MVCRIATGIGVLPEAVWAMSWPEAVGLLEHWQHSPPTNELLAAFMGVERTNTARYPEANSEADAVMSATGVGKEEFASLLKQHGIDGMVMQ